MIQGIFFFIGIGFVLCFLGYIVFFILGIVFHEFRELTDSYILRLGGKFDSNLKDKYANWFAGKFLYYDRLPEHLKLKFLIRVRGFVRSKEFIGRDELEVTEEMKMMIAASAIQLTIGLKKYTLDRFEKILVYPEKFLSKITGQYHIGEANTKGLIVISWADFKKGYAYRDDTYNVGLHEMAHALELEKRLGSDSDEFFSLYFNTWRLFANEEFSKMQEEEHPSFLRSYAATNEQEFFAVCIEHFFEAAQAFKDNLPQLYAHLCILLNQDPLQPDLVVRDEFSRKMVWSNEELDSLEPELFIRSTPIPSVKVASRDLLIGFIALVYLMQLDDIRMYVLFGLAAVLYILTRLLLVSGTIKLYKEVIVIHKLFRKEQFQYPLRKVVQFNIVEDDYRTAEMQLTMAYKGQIIRRKHTIQLDEEDENELKFRIDKLRRDFNENETEISSY